MRFSVCLEVACRDSSREWQDRAMPFRIGAKAKDEEYDHAAASPNADSMTVA